MCVCQNYIVAFVSNTFRHACQRNKSFIFDSRSIRMKRMHLRIKDEHTGPLRAHEKVNCALIQYFFWKKYKQFQCFVLFSKIKSFRMWLGFLFQKQEKKNCVGVLFY